MTAVEIARLGSEDSILLRAVVAQPDRDEPRLAYADWLSRQESPISRAWSDFIRLQLDLESTELSPADWAEKARHERLLMLQFRAAWEKPLRAALVPSIRQPGAWLMAQLFGRGGIWGFRRGFIEASCTSGGGFLDHELSLRTLTPIRHAVLNHSSFVIGRLLEEPYLDTMKSLHLVADMETDEQIELLVQGAIENGAEILEMRLPNLRWSWAVMAGMSRERTEASETDSIEDVPLWQQASPLERHRIEELFLRPQAARALDPSLPTTEIDLLTRNDAVYLGDLVRKANIWAVAKSYHDPEDSFGRCRRLLIFKPRTANRLIMAQLRESAYYMRDWVRS